MAFSAENTLTEVLRGDNRSSSTGYGFTGWSTQSAPFDAMGWIYGIALLSLGVVAYWRFSPSIKWGINTFFAANLTTYWLLMLFWEDWKLGEFFFGTILYTLLMLTGLGLTTVWLDSPADSRSVSSSVSPGTTTTSTTETSQQKPKRKPRTRDQDEELVGTGTEEQTASDRPDASVADATEPTSPRRRVGNDGRDEQDATQIQDSEDAKEEREPGEGETDSTSEPEDPLEVPTEDADEELVNELTEMLQNDDGSERKAAVEKLGEVGTMRPALVKPAVDDLKDCRLDPDPEVSQAASDILKRLRSEL